MIFERFISVCIKTIFFFLIVSAVYWKNTTARFVLDTWINACLISSLFSVFCIFAYKIKERDSIRILSAETENFFWSIQIGFLIAFGWFHHASVLIFRWILRWYYYRLPISKELQTKLNEQNNEEDE